MSKKLIWAVRITGAAALLLSFPVRSLFGTLACDVMRIADWIMVWLFSYLKIAGRGNSGK